MKNFFQFGIGFLVLVFLMVFTSCIYASTSAADQQFIASMQNDYETINSFVINKMAGSLGFYASSGWQDTSSSDFLVGPQIAVGVDVGAELVHIGSINQLPLSALVGSDNLNMPSYFPIPLPVVYGTIGLLSNLNLGIKYTSIPSEWYGSVFYGDHGTGFQAQYQIIKGPLLPSISILTSWNMLKGDSNYQMGINQQGTYTVGGKTYNDTINGTADYNTFWNIYDWEFKIMIAKNMGIFYPYAEIAFQKNYGTLGSVLLANVQQTLSDGSSSNENFNIATSVLPQATQLKYEVGFEIGALVKWGVLFETDGVNIYEGNTGFQLNF